jgi:hypothetical protein
MASDTVLIVPISRLTVLGSHLLHQLIATGKSLSCPNTQTFSDFYCSICIMSANLTRARFPSGSWHLLQRRSKSTWCFLRWKCARSVCSSYPPNIVLGSLVYIIFYREAIPRHPLDVLCYAVKHGYSKLSKVAVPMTLSISLHEVSRVMEGRPDIILKWVRIFCHKMHSLFSAAELHGPPGPIPRALVAPPKIRP